MADDNLQVLLIEDNPADRRLIGEFLLRPRNDGFSLHSAGTLKEGIQYLRESTAHIVLLDLSLPDSSGIGTVQRLREEFPFLPVVVLTGFDDEIVGTEALHLGAQDYLVKNDVNRALLKRSLRYAMERFRTEKALRASQEEYRSLIEDVFNTSSVGVIILDKHFKVVWVNDALLKYFGMQREDIIGHDKRTLLREKLKDIFQDPDDFERKLLASYEDARSAGLFECLVRGDTNRETRWLEHWSQPIRSGIYLGGRIQHYADITLRKRVEMAEHQQRMLAEALGNASALLTSTLNLDEVLDRILISLEQVISYDRAEITLHDDGDVHVARSYAKTQQRPVTAMSTTEEKYPAAEFPFLARMLSTRLPLLVNDIRRSSYWEKRAEKQHFASYLGAPISFQSEIVGFISIYSVNHNQYDRVDAQRLLTFGSHAAIAIHNAELHKQSHQLAAQRERQRLARELHDSVSQTLFTATVMAESALKQWDHHLAKARSLTEDVHQLTQGALAEMRVLLLELRPKALEQAPLSNLLELLAQAIRGRGMVTTHLDTEEVPLLPLDVKVGLYRIAQEALNNIVKHSSASVVNIRAQMQGRGLILEIRDDGRGFDEQQISGTSLGLDIMKERADEIKAQLNVESTPDMGTVVRVRWADQTSERDKNNEYTTP